MPAQSCKKVVGSGSRTTVIMQEERCFGYYNAEVADQEALLGQPKLIEITSESVINDIGTLESNALTPQRARFRRQQGSRNIGGDLNMEFSNNGPAWLIVQAIGKIVGQGLSNDPYTILPVDNDGVASDGTAGYLQNSSLYTSEEIHYDSAYSSEIGYERGYYTVNPNAMEPGFSLLISRDGGTVGGITGSAPVDMNWFKYTGMKVNTLALTGNSSDLSTITFSLLGRKEEIVDVPAPSYISRPDVNDPFAGFNAEVEIDDASECVLSYSLNVNNNLDGDKFCMGDKFRNSLPEGRREIDGEISMELSDLRFYNKFVTGTSAKIVIYYDLLGDGTETIKIILPKVEFNGTTPTSGGPETLTQTLPFVALFEKESGSPGGAYDLLLTGGALTLAPYGFDIAFEIVTAGTLV